MQSMAGLRPPRGPTAPTVTLQTTARQPPLSQAEASFIYLVCLVWLTKSQREWGNHTCLHEEQRRWPKLTTDELGLHPLPEDPVFEQRGREKENSSCFFFVFFFYPGPPRQFCLWANKAEYNTRSLPVVRVWVGLHTEPCGCQVTGWRSS